METYCQPGVGLVQVDVSGPSGHQEIFKKDKVTVVAKGSPLKPGVLFNVTAEGRDQTKDLEIYFQEPGSGAIGFTDEAVIAILYHRMRLKYAATGNDQWLTAAKYLEDVEESIQAAIKHDREVASGQTQ